MFLDPETNERLTMGLNWYINRENGRKMFAEVWGAPGRQAESTVVSRGGRNRLPELSDTTGTA